MAGSSSGKSGIARCLQAVLPDPWLAFGVDTLIQAMPVSSPMSAPGLQITSDGAVTVGRSSAGWRERGSRGWLRWLTPGPRSSLMRFLGGAASQQRWKRALDPLQVLRIGVRCESTVAAGRELAPG
jgi:chloramphenicol 3-O phosphotransferase